MQVHFLRNCERFGHRLKNAQVRCSSKASCSFCISSLHPPVESEPCQVEQVHDHCHTKVALARAMTVEAIDSIHQSMSMRWDLAMPKHISHVWTTLSFGALRRNPSMERVPAFGRENTMSGSKLLQQSLFVCITLASVLGKESLSSETEIFYTKYQIQIKCQSQEAKPKNKPKNANLQH